jgi:hypothetical protein
MKNIVDIIDNFLNEIQKETENRPYLDMMFFVSEKEYKKIKDVFMSSANKKELVIKRSMAHSDPEARYETYRFEKRWIKFSFRVDTSSGEDNED